MNLPDIAAYLCRIRVTLQLFSKRFL